MKNSIIILMLMLAGCAKDSKVTIDQRPVVNNYYNTYVTEVTQIIREEIKGATIIELVHPCGLEGKNFEIFLRLSTGQLIAVYDGDSGNDVDNTRLVQIEPGSYITTHSNPICNFKVTDDLKVEPSTVTEL